MLVLNVDNGCLCKGFRAWRDHRYRHLVGFVVCGISNGSDMKKFILILTLALAGCASIPAENIHVGLQYGIYPNSYYMDSWGFWHRDFSPHHYGRHYTHFGHHRTDIRHH